MPHEADGSSSQAYLLRQPSSRVGVLILLPDRETSRLLISRDVSQLSVDTISEKEAL
jgi:hypothetical protein